ncbi:hypothetical protein [Streptomyces sp. Ncost-T10-10d]|uniref:hypothetical protein n=1 Tax=Streptomyces sp. Ncost-T10-10d TaxID=1839774 RepID=UPI00081F1E91|nr:hypothetical protein [Streptomyces sp. Ncost-T10-10d]SCF91019.1 hypothetical protein GA0115254_124335 [Streptomyces sp. Ncost-T10-10d]
MNEATNSPFTHHSANGLDTRTKEKPFTGDFETHLTVRLCGREEASLLRFAECNGLKYSRIVLDRGRTPDQPMLTVSGRGTLALQKAVAGRHVEQLRGEGVEVTRVKIEAAPWNKDVPQTTWEAAQLPPQCYFEHHVKLALTDVDQVAEVRALCEPHAAHVSRNARRRLSGGHHERFVTQRCRLVGRPAARARLDALLASLANAGFAVAEVEEEFVVHDDNLVMDAGWIVVDGSGAV